MAKMKFWIKMRNVVLLSHLLFFSVKVEAQINTFKYFVPSKGCVSEEWKERYKDATIAKGESCLFSGMGYSYNRTYKSYGNFSIGAYLPISNMVETELGVGVLTSNTYDFSCVLRQRLPISIGEFFVEERLLEKVVKNSGVNDFSWNIIFGYRKEHLSIGLGFSNRTLSLLSPDYTNKYDYISEPFNFTYRLEYFVRPQTSIWNMSLAITNYDRFLVERFVQPFFELNGICKISSKLSTFFSSRIEQSGMTALSSEFYGINTCFGITYKL